MAALAISACRWPSGWSAAVSIYSTVTYLGAPKRVSSPAAAADDRQKPVRYGTMTNRE